MGLNDGGAVSRYEREYSYDAGGNLLGWSHAPEGALPGNSWNHEKWVSSTSNRSYLAYDLDGNAVSNPASKFDDKGQLIELPNLRSMHWSPRGQLRKVVLIERTGGDPDDDETYDYAADGKRLRKTTRRLVSGNVETTETVYLDGCELRRIKVSDDPNPDILILERWSSHAEVSDGRLATLYRWTLDTNERETDDTAVVRTHYHLGGNVGSVALELDASGDLIGYEEYFPYGGTAFVAGDNVLAMNLRTLRFAGKDQDDATGFSVFQFRYYAHFLGNWVSPDPAGEVDGPNRFWYARNNPATLSDSSGLDADDVTLAVPTDDVRSTIDEEHEQAAAVAYYNRTWGREHGVDIRSLSWTGTGWKIDQAVSLAAANAQTLAGADMVPQRLAGSADLGAVDGPGGGGSDLPRPHEIPRPGGGVRGDELDFLDEIVGEDPLAGIVPIGEPSSGRGGGRQASSVLVSDVGTDAPPVAPAAGEVTNVIDFEDADADPVISDGAVFRATYDIWYSPEARADRARRRGAAEAAVPLALGPLALALPLWDLGRSILEDPVGSAERGLTTALTPGIELGQLTVATGTPQTAFNLLASRWLEQAGDAFVERSLQTYQSREAAMGRMGTPEEQGRAQGQMGVSALAIAATAATPGALSPGASAEAAAEAEAIAAAGLPAAGGSIAEVSTDTGVAMRVLGFADDGGASTVALGNRRAILAPETVRELLGGGRRLTIAKRIALQTSGVVDRRARASAIREMLASGRARISRLPQDGDRPIQALRQLWRPNYEPTLAIPDARIVDNAMREGVGLLTGDGKIANAVDALRTAGHTSIPITKVSW